MKLALALVLLVGLAYANTEPPQQPVGLNCPLAKSEDYVCEAKVNLAADQKCWMPSAACAEEWDDRCYCPKTPPESYYGKCVIEWRCQFSPRSTTISTTSTENPNGNNGKPLTVGQTVAIAVVVTIVVLAMTAIGCYWWCIKYYIPRIVG